MKKSVTILAISALMIQAQEPTDSTITDDSVSITDSSVVTDSTDSDFNPDSDFSSDSYNEDSLIQDEPERTGYSTFRAHIGGSYFDLAKLNRSLARYGFPTLDNAAVQFGFGTTTQKTRIVKEYGINIYAWRSSKNPDRFSDLTGVNFSLTYGFDFLKPSHVSLFPYAGFDAGALFLQMSYRGIQFSDLATASAPEDQILHRYTLNVQTGLGFDVRKKRDGFMPSIGFRAGYRFDVTDPTRWYRGLSSVDGGAEASTSGPYAKVVFGIALPR